MGSVARTVLVAVLGFAVLGGSVSACDSVDCKSYAAAGIAVTVVEADETPICDADVSVVQRDAVEKPDAFDQSNAACTYFAAYEKPGTYSIRVVSHGRSQRIDDVKVTRGQCHVHLQRVAITFPAAGATGTTS